eukprot:m.13337 g.13337  ORF g.13337 m.13337 type:complete len:921 (-) comp7245_c0_seq1:236-2998(-)
MNAGEELDTFAPPAKSREAFSTQPSQEKIELKNMSPSGSSYVIKLENNGNDVDDEAEDMSKSQMRTRLHTINMTDRLAARSATQVYGSKERKHEMASKHLLNSGKCIDFILVAKLPSEEKREELDNLARVPATSDDPSEVKQVRKRAEFLGALEAAGFDLEREVSPDGDTVFIKIHAHFDVLLEEAEKANLRKALKPDASSHLSGLLVNKSITDKLFTTLSPAKYLPQLQPDVEEEPDFFSADFKLVLKDQFQNIEDETKFFTSAERASLVWEMLSRISYGGKSSQVGIKKLLANGTFTAAFPLHDGPYEVDPDNKDPYDVGVTPNDRKKLFEVWGQLKFWYKFQPYDLIARYFGVKIGLYYAWLGFYTFALIVPGILGFIVFINGLANYRNQQDSRDICNSNFTMCPLCDNGCEEWFLNLTCNAYERSYWFDNEATIAFAFFMSVWASIFIDFWKRRNAQLAYEWDVLDFSEEERDRPQFRGTKERFNPVTGEREKYYPSSVRLAKQVGSFATMVFMLAIVITIVFSIIIYRVAVRAVIFARSDDAQQASTITAVTAGILNLVGIVLMNKIYDGLAVRLTDWENHQKESEYEASLTSKIFLFSFVNSFASIFYIAFFKGKFVGRPGAYNTLAGFRQDECPPYGCMLELTIQLAIIMVGRQIINNVMEMVMPAVMRKIRNFLAPKELKESARRLLPWENEYLNLAPFPQYGMFPEYLEMILQFGFLSLFVSAFSLAPFFALLNNILEIRIDAHKLITVYRRPPAERASNIGIWDEVLQFISYFSVLTNGLVIAFSSNFIPREVWRYAHDGTLEGYIHAIHPLSPINDTESIYYNCHYFGLYEADGTRGQFYYEVIAARLGFLIIFEHIVFLCKFLFQYMIPDVPAAVTLAVQREEHLAKVALDKALHHQAEKEHSPETSS